jgi:hypothetical protein
MHAEISDLEAALRSAVRQRELAAKALIDGELIVRDLKAAIRQAIEAIDRKRFEAARVVLKQALDETPGPKPDRER